MTFAPLLPFVISFHVFPNKVRGGFVGVDVFVVISGILICSRILASLDSGSLSFWSFMRVGSGVF